MAAAWTGAPCDVTIGYAQTAWNVGYCGCALVLERLRYSADHDVAYRRGTAGLIITTGSCSEWLAASRAGRCGEFTTDVGAGDRRRSCRARCQAKSADRFAGSRRCKAKRRRASGGCWRFTVGDERGRREQAGRPSLDRRCSEGSAEKAASGDGPAQPRKGHDQLGDGCSQRAGAFRPSRPSTADALSKLSSQVTRSGSAAALQQLSWHCAKGQGARPQGGLSQQLPRLPQETGPFDKVRELPQKALAGYSSGLC